MSKKFFLLIITVFIFKDGPYFCEGEAQWGLSLTSVTPFYRLILKKLLKKSIVFIYLFVEKDPLVYVPSRIHYKSSREAWAS